MPSTLVIRNVHLAYEDTEHAHTLFDIIIVDGKVSSVDNAAQLETTPQGDTELEVVDAEGEGLLIPSLCHAHIHLDKCFLLDRCELRRGDFAEALSVTAQAKAAFLSDPADLYARGRRLIVESVAAGVTRMRAHVEVDATVRSACLDAAQKLKRAFRESCDVEISLFAQDPLFPSPVSSDPGENYRLIAEAAASSNISCIGSAPYVEPTTEHAKANLRLILDLAHQHGLHADFHLDYNLDASRAPLIWFLLSELRTRMRAGRWAGGRTVCVGHATRLALFSAAEWARFAHEVGAGGLPVALVGLPQSDVYMMGRGLSPVVPRGTLDVVRLPAEHRVHAAMAVNNVANAFTPQGPPDPLALCPLGVALFQAGTTSACGTLLRSVTSVAHAATGQARSSSLLPRIGDIADFVILHGCSGIQDTVCNPCYDRTTIKDGQVVAQRKGTIRLRYDTQSC